MKGVHGRKSDKDTSHRLTYTVDEAGRLAGLGRNQAYQAVHSGAFPAIRIGNRWLVLKKPFDRMLAGEGLARV